MDFVRSVYKKLKQFGDPERRKLSEWYFPTSMEVIGLKAADHRSVVSVIKKELRNCSDAEIIARSVDLCKSGIFECQLAGYAILNRNYKIISRLNYDIIMDLGTFMDNWVSTDSFSTQVAGPAWRIGVIEDENVTEWAMSTDRWWRRNALVATVGLNLRSQGGVGDPDRTLMICRMLVGDRDDMVVKAMSWALRELSKRDPGNVREFMSDFESLLPGRVKREVYNKLETGRKN
jgi:3-methyladenine DNA glycosylase AlkD